MNVGEGITAVLEALHEVTDTYGTQRDRPKVKAYLQDPDAVPFSTYIYVGRIPLSNFYAGFPGAFDKVPLWQGVRRFANQPDLPQPEQWAADSRVVDLALWIHAKAEE